MEAKIWNKSFWISETDHGALVERFEPILLKSGFHIEGMVEKHFKPFGYSVVWLLSESHFAVHTFPEESKCYCELSSCVEECFNNFLKLEGIKIDAK